MTKSPTDIIEEIQSIMNRTLDQYIGQPVDESQRQHIQCVANNMLEEINKLNSFYDEVKAEVTSSGEITLHVYNSLCKMPEDIAKTHDFIFENGKCYCKKCGIKGFEGINHELMSTDHYTCDQFMIKDIIE